MPYCISGSSIKFQGHTGWKNRRFESSLSKITRPVAAIKSLRFALLSRKYHSDPYFELISDLVENYCFLLRKRNSIVWCFAQYSEILLSWNAVVFPCVEQLISDVISGHRPIVTQFPVFKQQQRIGILWRLTRQIIGSLLTANSAVLNYQD